MDRLLRVIGIVVLTAAVLGCGKGSGVASVSPSSGALTGGDSVTITGEGFRPDVGISVYFGSAKADNVIVRNSETISVTIPNYKLEGPIDIRIITDDGKETLMKQAFTYVNKVSGDETKELRSINQRKDLRE